MFSAPYINPTIPINVNRLHIATSLVVQALGYVQLIGHAKDGLVLIGPPVWLIALTDDMKTVPKSTADMLREIIPVMKFAI